MKESMEYGIDMSEIDVVIIGGGAGGHVAAIKAVHLASTTYTAGTKAGERRITASADNKSKTVTINLIEKE